MWLFTGSTDWIVSNIDLVEVVIGILSIYIKRVIYYIMTVVVIVYCF